MDSHYFHLRDVERYGQKWDHVFETSTYQMTQDLEAARPILTTYRSDGDSHSGYGHQYGLLDDAIQILKNGGPAGETIQPLTLPSGLTSQAAPRQQLVRRASGPLWNVPRLLQGDPRPAYNFKSLADGRHRLARLAVSCFMSGGMDSEMMKRRGRAIGSLLLALKRADYELECRLLYIGFPAIAHDMSKNTSKPCRLLREGHKSWIPATNTDRRYHDQNGRKTIMVDMPVHLPGRTLDYKRVAGIFGSEVPIANALWPWRAITFGTAYFGPIDEGRTADYFHRHGWIYINNTVNGFSAEDLAKTGALCGRVGLQAGLHRISLEEAIANPWESDENARIWIVHQLTSMGVYGRE